MSSIRSYTFTHLRQYYSVNIMQTRIFSILTIYETVDRGSNRKHNTLLFMTCCMRPYMPRPIVKGFDNKDHGIFSDTGSPKQHATWKTTWRLLIDILIRLKGPSITTNMRKVSLMLTFYSF